METSSFTDYRTQAAPLAEPEQSVWGAAPRISPAPLPRTEDAEFPEDLTVVSTRQLRVLCNQTYRGVDVAVADLERFEDARIEAFGAHRAGEDPQRFPRQLPLRALRALQ